MTLENLFNSIKYGEDRYANMKSSTSNIKHIDEDYNLYLVSSRVKELLPLLGENSQVLNLVNKMTTKFEDYEQRILSGSFVSSVYSRMKMDSLVENYNDFAHLLTENKKLVREIDPDILGRIMGSIQSGIKVFAEKSEKEAILESFPVSVEKSIKEEARIITELLAE